MEDDADDVKDDLRTELFMLLQDLKRLEYVGVDDVCKFLSKTSEIAAELQIPKLRKFIARMQTVKASLMPELTSKTKRRRDQEDTEPDQKDAEPDRDGGRGARAPKNSAQIEQRYRREGPSGYESPDRSRAPLEKKKRVITVIK